MLLHTEATDWNSYEEVSKHPLAFPSVKWKRDWLVPKYMQSTPKHTRHPQNSKSRLHQVSSNQQHQSSQSHYPASYPSPWMQYQPGSCSQRHRTHARCSSRTRLHSRRFDLPRHKRSWCSHGCPDHRIGGRRRWTPTHWRPRGGRRGGRLTSLFWYVSVESWLGIELYARLGLSVLGDEWGLWSQGWLLRSICRIDEMCKNENRTQSSRILTRLLYHIWPHPI